jgi:hypothetical protein
VPERRALCKPTTEIDREGGNTPALLGSNGDGATQTEKNNSGGRNTQTLQFRLYMI